HFDEDGVADTLFDCACEFFCVCNEQVVTHELHFGTEFLCKEPCTFPVVFIQSVFDGDDRIFIDHFCIPVDHIFCRVGFTFAFEFVFSCICIIELAGRCIHCKTDLFARLITCFLHCFDDRGERLFVGTEVRSESAFVSHTCVVA